MKAIAKVSHVNTALQVIQRMDDGIPLISACKEVGIPRSTLQDGAWHAGSESSVLFSPD